MRRRDLLTGLPAALGIGSLSGCLSRYGVSADDIGAGGDETEQPSLTVTDRSFRVTETRCGSETETTTVSSDDALVAVTGTITAPSSCYTAELGGANYDAEADELSVTVTTVERTDVDVCTQCLTEIDYEAKIEFEGGRPGSVTVTHESRGSSRAVTPAATTARTTANGTAIDENTSSTLDD